MKKGQNIPENELKRVQKPFSTGDGKLDTKLNFAFTYAETVMISKYGFSNSDVREVINEFSYLFNEAYKASKKLKDCK